MDWLVAGAQEGDSLFFHCAFYSSYSSYVHLDTSRLSMMLTRSTFSITVSGHGTQVDDEDGDEPEGKDDSMSSLDILGWTILI